MSIVPFHQNVLNGLSMSLPEYLEAKDIPTGSNEPCGIICKLKTQVSNILSYVEATSTSKINRGEPSNIIK